MTAAGKDLLDAALMMIDGRRKFSGSQMIIEGYAEMYPELRGLADRLLAQVPPEMILTIPTAPKVLLEQEEERPKGAEAIHLILQEYPNTEYRVSECVAELRKRGWLPESDNPANAVRAALERLVANSEESDVIKIVGRGYVAYSYQPDRIRDSESEGGYGYDEEPF
jgi:hypothetical protein